MLEKLQIKNYRSCQDAVFEPRPDLSVLIGPNGSGKTTILRALLLLRQLTKEERPRRHAEETADECNLKAWFQLKNSQITLNAAVKLYTEDDNSDTVVESDESWIAPEITGSKKKTRLPLRMSRMMYGGVPREQVYFDGSVIKRVMESDYQPLLKPINEIGTFLAQLKYYSASQFTDPSLCPVSIEVERTGRFRRALSMRKGHSRFLYDLYTSFKSKDSGFEEFFSVIGPDGIGLVNSIGFKEIPTSSVDYTVRSGGKIRELKREKLLVIPQFSVGSNTLSPSQLSEGTFKTITLLFYVMTERSSALLIEEPEVCVHHGLLSSIVELMKTYSHQKQIIVSTHSDFILDKIEPLHVFAVSNTTKTGTVVKNLPKAMSSKELTALKSFLENDGNLGEYWRHGGLD